MSAARISIASLPSFCQKLSKLVEIWRSSDENSFAQFFWDTVYKALLYWATTNDADHVLQPIDVSFYSSMIACNCHTALRHALRRPTVPTDWHSVPRVVQQTQQEVTTPDNACWCYRASVIILSGCAIWWMCPRCGLADDDVKLA